jgi:hypothetical protein
MTPTIEANSVGKMKSCVLFFNHLQALKPFNKWFKTASENIYNWQLTAWLDLQSKFDTSKKRLEVPVKSLY